MRQRGDEAMRRVITQLAVLFTLAAGCSTGAEIAVQNAREGDLLVKGQGVLVHLVRPFQRGVANGQYGGAVKVVGAAGEDREVLHEVNAVCSLAGQPGWPEYDNLYGQPIAKAKQRGTLTSPTRWQILYHFDGRVERTGKVPEGDWPERLRDNLCRRGDFDDRPTEVRERDKGS